MERKEGKEGEAVGVGEEEKWAFSAGGSVWKPNGEQSSGGE
jgi:hypothetical protein